MKQHAHFQSKPRDMAYNPDASLLIGPGVSLLTPNTESLWTHVPGGELEKMTKP